MLASLLTCDAKSFEDLLLLRRQREDKLIKESLTPIASPEYWRVRTITKAIEQVFEVMKVYWKMHPQDPVALQMYARIIGEETRGKE